MIFIPYASIIVFFNLIYAIFIRFFANTSCMKKGVKITISVLLISSALGLSVFLCGLLLIEPAVKVNGFAALDKARLDNVSKTVTVLDASGERISDAIYDNNKIYTRIDALPEYVPAAFVAIEDKRFYSHHGIDYLRIISAAKNNIFSGSFKEGGSTISQQLIKNTHLKSDKTISRKIQEIRIARDLERHYSKSQILEMYMNILYFGNNIYGIGTAANVIFGKSASELTLAQSALLAGIINNPSKFSPFTEMEAAVSRRDKVLKRMLEQQFIDETQYNEAINETAEISDVNLAANQYINSCLGEASMILGKDKSALFDEGYVIHSYYDAGLQTFLDRLICGNTIENGEINIIVAENYTGRFIANSGSTRKDLSGLKRSPGSTIKPLLCYAPALELKNVYAVTPILDEKTKFGDWEPSNFNDKYYGWISVEESLVRSLNIPAVKLLEINGVEQSKKIARRFGIEFNRKDVSLALALGGMTDGVTLNSLTDAYRVFANGGVYTPAKYVKAIYDKNGACVYSSSPICPKRAVSQETAYLITDMLQKCAKTGTAKQVKYSNCNAAAKTGTAGNKDGNTDAYCIAYTPKYTVAVRINATDGLLDNKYSGGNLPAKLVKKVLVQLNDKSNFPIPENIVTAEIDAVELIQNKKVLLAGDGVKPKDRLSALFSADNMPTAYSSPNTFIENDTVLDDFDNFTIID